ncbi:ArsR/SmtB family transcription factor [Streptomyces chiangmaiensis]|uniref:Metalloregulator ArsR/SmtB family transcription factor n=1 Tax=Streptomyces chiangmaiensis TaxID=766497 RepID=A0ABU7FLQ1_9ACTN|nr:metalloregulator ArsR/SmtB family transcription factor [Streptomyces chiangmaiensis]MED7825050.1 metalloregulator ArsR/SmtB family transcription factor [Streptomyces chiangmaiensis]
MSERNVREGLFGQLARIGKAISNPKRIELLDILGQGERSVESLATVTHMTVGNTSSHLQVLRNARMVETRKEGTKVFYSLADERVAGFVRELWSLADARLAEVDRLIREYLQGEETLERVTREQLVSRSLSGNVYIIDVRPTEEYAAGHIPGAVSVPFDELTEHLAKLPADMDIVAYCRGPHCVFAPKAAQILRQHGLRAMVLEDGMPEWRQGGLPVSTASS